MTNYHMLDITSYLNNVGCTNDNNISHGELSLGKLSLPEKFLPFGSIFYYEKIPFKFIKYNQYDNIELSGQIINFKAKQITKVHLLGTASEADMYGDVHFCNNNQIVHSDKMFFSHFTKSKSSFRDQLALQFPYIHLPTGILNQVSPSIWYDVISFPKSTAVSSIHFEDNPCLHLFCLTIELGDL
ncbi:hypothetical protein [Paenibacillus tyrfis]|uniref:hypothetical protein n=1 Tax=Paenibacillus tyrfis TaxID=1501230 RepID=UPI00209EB510|nr:hypothetical protein [Paenibacillus tyrfis]MCP1311557.1 hypothetical protein [Paenibacillus tyrfis]